MAQGYMRQLRAHSGQCGAEGEGYVFSGRKHVDESLQSSVVEKFVACKADLLGGVPGGIALFRGSCVVSTVESGDFEAD